MHFSSFCRFFIVFVFNNVHKFMLLDYQYIVYQFRLLFLADRNVTSSCHHERKDNVYLQSYLYVLILGQILHGFGGTTFHIIGVSLLDDSVPASSSPMYIGKHLLHDHTHRYPRLSKKEWDIFFRTFVCPDFLSRVIFQN